MKIMTQIVALTLLLLLVSCSTYQPHEHATATADKRAVQLPEKKAEKLGTKWGDDVTSHVTEVNMARKTTRPLEIVRLFYANKTYQGQRINAISLLSGVVELSVTSEGRRLPMYRRHGRYYLRGRHGQAYQLEYKNHSRSKTFEVTTSVDGLNVLDGRQASYHAHGYVLRPGATVVIKGFRKSRSSVASFIFSRPEESYANHSQAGRMSNTGVIGVSLFELRDPNNRTTPQAFPADQFAPPPF